jgi:hypothetical protein
VYQGAVRSECFVCFCFEIFLDLGDFRRFGVIWQASPDWENGEIDCKSDKNKK